MRNFMLHLVSDSTGETVGLLARACLVQFDDIEPDEKIWPMVRGANKVNEVLAAVEQEGGFVLYTLVDRESARLLEEGCARLQVPCIPVLEPIVAAFAKYLGAEMHARPGQQHVMDAEYFARIEAMQYALAHDDGQSTWDLEDADVILLGVSRTSKTPTCIYLANRGIKAANVPIVPGCPIPEQVFKVTKPLIVGLNKDPKRLVEIRRQRLKLLDQDENTDYVDFEAVSREINEAKRLYAKLGWPTINVSRRSIEETAAQILSMYQRRTEGRE
ncbi:MAG: pyruvate, water dikinase regulatory protein [Rhodospirillaceae bacterium]